MAKCMHCDEIKKGDISSTGNFKSHYKLKHSKQVKALEEYLKSDTEVVKGARQSQISDAFPPKVNADIVSMPIKYRFLSVTNCASNQSNW